MPDIPPDLQPAKRVSAPDARRLGRRASGAPGFALVVTLSLMVLLVLLSLGMLGLSAISMRGSSHAQAQAAARANARLALMLAIGELQKHAGADTRVTAPSGIVDEMSPPLTGVWKSWQGSDHESTGRPLAPDYDSKNRAAADSNGRFLAWLVSGTGAVGDPANPGALALSTAIGDTVPLLSSGTLGTGSSGEVHLAPQPLEGTGSFAWWVSGENQKARLPVPYQPEDGNSAAQWSDIAKSHTVTDPKPFELDSLLADPSPARKAVSLHTANLLVPDGAPKPRESFHDLSVSSVGLLTNTATGGWRKDLSLVTENWDALPASGLPFFRINASTTTSVSKPTNQSYQAPQSILYPWSSYWAGASSAPIYQHGAVSTWHSLKDYATAYRRITAAPGGNSIPFQAANILSTVESFNYLHRSRTTPVIARVHWLFSHRTMLLQDDPDPAKRTYSLQLLITPVVTMWNPFNVAITSPANLRIVMGKPMPCSFRHYNKDGAPLPQYRRVTAGLDHLAPHELPGNHPVMPPGANSLSYLIPAAFTLAPGETRVYSPTTTVGIGAGNLGLGPGYRPGTGHSVNVSSYAGELNADSAVKVDVTFDARFKEINHAPEVVGVWLDMFLGASGGNYLQVNRMQYPQETANRYWPPIPAGELASPTAAEIEGVWQPFLSAVYGSRISGPSSTGLPGKGLLQASPMVSYVRMQSGFTESGVAHPANASNDFSFFKHTGNDDRLPNANNTNHRGYIISGFTAAAGLSRVILVELPLRPLVSLGELQNWDLRYQNGMPPFQLNVIANSDAAPIIPPDRVFNSGGSRNLQHDDSYCANHLLFDDWFFSSIAPEPAGFGSMIAADLPTRYGRFLRGEQPLVNRAYQPIAEDQNPGAEELSARIDAALGPDGWQRVASRLEVEGMFNVNSTSVKAWRALLGHARNQKMPYHTEGGIDLSGETDHVFTRFSVAGDTRGGEPGLSGGFQESSELTGYRVFDDTMLEILAEKIVGQVRLRGPFLSLSEFVNRQLSGDEDLALAGAIQTALNQMSGEAGTNDPYQKLKSPDLSQDAGDPDDPRLAGAAYVFPAAAVGKSTYGLPGWIRQADVLRPLAPILSARDDTFTIRVYGDARDNEGTVIARSWCEATVRRTRDFVDPADPADSVDAPTGINQLFGRRYELVSFRWLSPEEV